jgi:hypothetical protein
MHPHTTPVMVAEFFFFFLRFERGEKREHLLGGATARGQPSCGSERANLTRSMIVLPHGGLLASCGELFFFYLYIPAPFNFYNFGGGRAGSGSDSELSYVPSSCAQ